MDWQPMDTAPKNAKILISCLVKRTGYRVTPCVYKWHKTNDDDRYKKEWWSDGGDYYGIKWLSDIYEPTHWMPLPEPPVMQLPDVHPESEVSDG